MTYQYTTEHAKRISDTIIQQLGGNKMQVMLAAYDFLFDTKGKTTFKFKGSRKVNFVTIELNSNDEYTVTFYKFNKSTYDLKKVSTSDGITCSTIKKYFEEQTGLYLGL